MLYPLEEIRKSLEILVNKQIFINKTQLQSTLSTCSITKISRDFVIIQVRLTMLAFWKHNKFFQKNLLLDQSKWYTISVSRDHGSCKKPKRQINFKIKKKRTRLTSVKIVLFSMSNNGGYLRPRYILVFSLTTTLYKITYAYTAPLVSRFACEN